MIIIEEGGPRCTLQHRLMTSRAAIGSRVWRAGPLLPIAAGGFHFPSAVSAAHYRDGWVNGPPSFAEISLLLLLLYDIRRTGIIFPAVLYNLDRSILLFLFRCFLFFSLSSLLTNRNIHHYIVCCCCLGWKPFDWPDHTHVMHSTKKLIDHHYNQTARPDLRSLFFSFFP